jgi:hypothetical protein
MPPDAVDGNARVENTRDDAHWSGHFDVTLDDQELAVTFTRAEPSDGGLA